MLNPTRPAPAAACKNTDPITSTPQLRLTVRGESQQQETVPPQQPQASPNPMLSRYLTAGRPIGVRSSLFSHTIPPFYACYLLKSVQTPQSTTVYIGSTPSPPRRIRQHNGELTQGARKTQRKRPWVMQMIVHGFPSRLAALKFEWAWQNPHRSRHLRDADGNPFGARASRMLKKNIAIVRTMIAKYPFSTWPLHVKLFTAEAVQCWDAAAAAKAAVPLPPGFTCAVELEGVDGKSGLAGSGRVGPISVDDEEFSAALLVKHTALMASGRNLTCSICDGPLHNYSSDPLHTTLCPATGCVATSHISCLAQHFSREQKDMPGLIPRGGRCTSCGEYTLWGDVVRGCYRRVPPAENDGHEHPDVATDDMFLSDEAEEGDEGATPEKHRKSSSSKKAARAGSARRTSKRKGKKNSSLSSTGESFDFTNIASSSEESDAVTPRRKPGRPRKNGTVSDLLPSVRIPSPAPGTSKRKTRTGSPTKKGTRKTKTQSAGNPEASSEGEAFDFDNIATSSDSDDVAVAKRAPGRPRKDQGLAPSAVLAPAKPAVQSPRDSPAPPPKLVRLASAKAKGKRKAPAVTLEASSSSEGEAFDFADIASSSGSDDAAPVKRKPGRPRKNSGMLPIISPGSGRARQAPFLNGHDVPSLTRPYHHSAPRTRLNFEPKSADARAGESFDFSGISPSNSIRNQADDENFARHLHYGDNDDALMHFSPPHTPVPARKSRAFTSSRRIWREGDLEGPMSALAMSTPNQASLQKKAGRSTWTRDGIEVIELSD